MSPQPSRRSVLAAIAASALAGCTTGRAPSTPTETDSTRATTATTGTTTAPDSTAPGDETTGFPPPAPTSSRPEDPRPIPGGSDWRAFQRDPANTGHHRTVTAVPDEQATYWQFYTRSTPPVVADGALYTVEFAGDRTLIERDAATGEMRWKTPVTRGGAATVPTVAGDAVLVPTYSYLYAFSRRDGARRWRYDLGRGTPTPAAVVDGTVFCCNGSFQGWVPTVFAVGLDGSERWTVELDGDLRGGLAHADGAVYAGTDAGAVTALRAADGSERWSVDVGASVRTALAAGNGAVFVHDDGGTVHALATADGSERWAAPASEPQRGTCPAVVEPGLFDAGTVFVPGAAGLHALSARDGSQRWRVETRDPAGTPTVAGGTVYVGATGFDDKAVRAVDARTGDVRWSQPTREKFISDYNVSGVFGPPTPVSGGVYVSAADGLWALGRDGA